MPLKFGTSGLRGLVTNMTDRECYLFARAFLCYTRLSGEIKEAALGGDFRASTPRVMRAVGFAIKDEACELLFQGILPTPAVTLYGIKKGIPSIMVTGSHIPDDRNGIKFNLPRGEILKRDEPGIMEQYRLLKGSEAGKEYFTEDGSLREGIKYDLPEAEGRAVEMYRDRLNNFFGNNKSLAGRKVVFYQHSSTSRDLIPEILEQQGAEVIRKGFSDTFVPVDTEAVQDLDKLSDWVSEYHADALFSTDGDGDRPLVVDDKGCFIRGDILGILVADFLGADAVVTPVSCSTSLERSGNFSRILRTRIGSPFVVEGMESFNEGEKVIVGYEANGGFLTGCKIPSPSGGTGLDPLPTRDAALPAISALLSAVKKGMSLSQLVQQLPARFSDAEIIRKVPASTGKKVMATLLSGGSKLLEEQFGQACGTVESTDNTDGYRILFSGGDILHFRPSGNAPEFRCYTESDSREKAAELARMGIEWARQLTIGD
jgi:phosphomannomutase